MLTNLSRGMPLPKDSKCKNFNDYAEELLANFPGIDRAELLKTVVALAIMDMRYGNKREERAACDLLNLVQAEAVKQLKARAESANAELSDAGNQDAHNANARRSPHSLQ